MNRDFGIAMKELSGAIVDTWKELVTERFYDAYKPSTYDRGMFPYETRDSIRILGIKKNGNRYDVEIGYDESLIHTYDNNGWTAHEDPSKMGGLFEYGEILGHDKRGIRAMETLIEDIHSGKFNYIFENALNKLGYDVKFK
jgi:hypothetical protein